MDSRRLNETCTLSILSCIKGREVAMAWDSNNNRQLKFPKGASSLFCKNTLYKNIEDQIVPRTS